MYSADRFEFTAAPPARASVTVDRSIAGKEALLARLAHGLSFPDTFGMNWDALIDCLSDLSWLREPEATIDHASPPDLSPGQLRLYLESLLGPGIGGARAASHGCASSSELPTARRSPLRSET